MLESNDTILDEAKKLIYGERNEAYGPVNKNWGRTAKLWSVVLGIEVTPKQVGLCMAQVKIAREIGNEKRDNLVDACGYLAGIEKMEVELCPKEPTT